MSFVHDVCPSPFALLIACSQQCLSGKWHGSGFCKGATQHAKRGSFDCVGTAQSSDFAPGRVGHHTLHLVDPGFVPIRVLPFDAS